MRRLALCCGVLVGMACSSGAPLVTHHVTPLSGTTQRLTWVDKPLLSAAGTRSMQYFGGNVIPNARVYLVYWGDPAQISTGVTAADGGMADFFLGVTNSDYLDWLNEYDSDIPAQAGSHLGNPGTGQHIGRGNYGGSFTLTAIPDGNVTDLQIQQALAASVASGALPPPDANALYGLFFPSSVQITLEGSTSCGSWLAYHNFTTLTSAHPAYYMVLPDCGSDTQTVSHELVEAITDAVPTPGSSPDFPQAWNTSDGNEVGDLCVGSGATVTTALGIFSVQGIWDERTKGCQSTTQLSQDFSIAFDSNSATLASGTPVTATLQSATVKGQPQPLTLSVVAPSGVSAVLSATTVTSGDSVLLTLTAGSGTLPQGQVTVQALGASNVGAQTHSAALLLH